MESETNKKYAELPGELLFELLDNVDSIARKATFLLNFDEELINSIADKLRDDNRIVSLDNQSRPLGTVMAVDGGSVFEKLTAADLLVSVAVGVEGVRASSGDGWLGKNQYHAWSGIMSHEEYNTRLLQGIMHLMEMIVLGESNYDTMIMDGSHLTPIIKINSLLSAKEEGAGPEYVEALSNFLQSRFHKVIPDIPNIFAKVFTDKRIIGLNKYNSSKDFIDGVLENTDIRLDDKAFFSIALREGEYTVPQSFGQSQEERSKRWNDLHITCNLEIPEKKDLNSEFEKILSPIMTKNNNSSSLFYLYFKPVGEMAYRLEIKQELAEDTEALETMLYNLKRQIAFPFMIEPVPQFIADAMAKHVGSATYSIKEAIRYSDKFKINREHLHLFASYRS